MFIARRVLASGLLGAASLCAQAQSQCFGTVSHGRLEGGVRLPIEGPNFAPYSLTAAAVGRTYVHSTVAEIFKEAYAGLEESMPDVAFVYGEAGWRSGGRFRPHRTHQNGLSVDFFVPVRDAAGRSVPIPTAPTNRFGYDLEFNRAGRLGELSIDFAALAAHLHQLDMAARRHGSRLALVIVDPVYIPKLLATPSGPQIRHLPYMVGKPWVRHDEHMHVDFVIPCKPLQR
jgi:penicillin-insensitive murein endopeptidase